MFLHLLACADPPPPPAAPAPAPKVEAPKPPPPPREAPNRPPVIGPLTITPAAPTVLDPIDATVEATDPDGQPVDLDFAWFVGEREVVGLASGRMLAGKHAKGDVVRVVVTATDGTETVTKEAQVTVANSPPSLDKTPGPRDRLDGFRFVAHDVDGDAITWKVENAPKGLTIDPRGVVRYEGSAEEKGGDYRVAVVAEDGETWTKFEVPLSVSPGSKGK
ncbi:MAG: hypothetical protein ACOZNI_04935 [Myxococcota bacterium]